MYMYAQTHGETKGQPLGFSSVAIYPDRFCFSLLCCFVLLCCERISLALIAHQGLWAATPGTCLLPPLLFSQPLNQHEDYKGWPTCSAGEWVLGIELGSTGLHTWALPTTPPPGPLFPFLWSLERYLRGYKWWSLSLHQNPNVQFPHLFSVPTFVPHLEISESFALFKKTIPRIL